jgi:predicted ATPase
MQYEAVRLFCERAAAVDPSFALTEENAAAVARLCADLDGIPLAIELAAARTKVLTVEEIVARLGDRFELLAGGRRTAQPRQQTLRAAMDWSYDLLSDEERALFASLSVFAGGWTLDAAEAVAAKDEGRRHFVTEDESEAALRGTSSSGLPPSAFSLQPSDVLDILTRLVDKSLVIVHRRGGEARYQMLETIRRYAAEKLRESGEAPRAAARHRDWFLRLAERGRKELAGPAGREWMRRLENEHDNLRAALQWSLREGGDPDASLRLAYALGQFWVARGHPSEGRVWAGEALAARGDHSPLARANDLYWIGSIALAEGHVERASALLESGLTLKDSLGKDQGAALGSQVLGRVAERLGDFERAESLHEQSLTLYRDLGDDVGIARALFGLGASAAGRGDFERASVRFEVALQVLRGCDDGQGSALVRYALGDALRRKGDLARALEHFRHARAEASGMGLRGVEALALRGQAAVESDRGDHDAAAALYREALLLCRDAGDGIGTAAAIEGLARVAAQQGEALRALSLAGAASVVRGTATQARLHEDRAALDKVLATARAELGSGAADFALASGRALAPEAAIELALAGKHGE